jgi:hypothetical protein
VTLRDGSRKDFGCVGLLLLIGLILFLDLFHGIALGQDQIAYQPIYRLRQSLAIAISRQHQPPPGGYLAYRSVVDAFSEHGFAIFDDDPGPLLPVAGWVALLNDGPKLNQVIQEARDAPVNPSLKPELIEGNELGLADYIFWSFRIFGEKISSLYYFYFLVLLMTCLLYVLQFKDNPFLLFMLVMFLGGLFFLENYAKSYGVQVNAIQNSRLFSALSLLPALHVIFALWRRVSATVVNLALVSGQSLVFAFILSCRTEAAWQVAMVIAVTTIVFFILIWREGGTGPFTIVWRRANCHALWPSVVFLLVVMAYNLSVSSSADKMYATEPKGHVIWHEVLQGLLASSPQLRSEYLGDVSAGVNDQGSYNAVMRDLNARNDASSSIARKLPDGQITIDLMKSWSEYDRLAKSLVLRMMMDHPLAVLKTVPIKVASQFDAFDNLNRATMSWYNFRVPVFLVLAGAALCLWAESFQKLAARSRVGGFLLIVVLLFAAVTPMIEPNLLAVGTLFAYLGALVVVVYWALVLLVGLLGRRISHTLGA